MLDIAPDLQGEYERWHKAIGDYDPYIGPGTLGITQVLKAHFLIADFFLQLGEGLGGVGPRDLNLLHSALHRQHVAYAGEQKWNDVYHKCGTLFFGLIKDHPFHDANKRTAFHTALYHLELVHVCPTVRQTDIEDLTVNIADNKLEKYARFRSLFKDNIEDPEVEFISDYFRRNTRAIDKRFYSVTYRQLDKILRRFGYELTNAHGNYIDVVRIEERRKIFGRFRSREKIGVKVAQIGFPGWTRPVGRGAIKTIRREAKLTHRDGVDSQTFFRDADPIDCLIAQYQEPLRRLAER